MGRDETSASQSGARLKIFGVLGGIALIALGTLAAWALEKRSAAEAELQAERSELAGANRELETLRDELSRAKLKLVGLADARAPTPTPAATPAATASQEGLKRAHADLHEHLKAVGASPAQSAALAGLKQAQEHESELSEQLQLLQTDLSVAKRNEGALNESLSACERKLRYGEKAGAGSVQHQAVQAPGMEEAPHIKVLKADPSHVIRVAEPSNSARDTE